MSPIRPTTRTQLPRDAVFEMLSCQRRRYTLHYLTQQGGVATLRTLSEQVAAWEHRIPVREISWSQRKNVYTALRQVHLPRMDELGIVLFDPDSGRIQLGDRIEDLELHLDMVPEDDIAWNKYYLGLSVFCGWLLIVAEGGLVPFSEVDLAVWAAAIVGLFGLSAVSHTYHDRRMRLGRDGPPPGYEHEPEAD